MIAPVETNIRPKKLKKLNLQLFKHQLLIIIYILGLY